MRAEGRADADGQALDRRDDRFAIAREAADEAEGRHVVGAALGGGEEIADVVAGGEHSARPFDEHGGDAFVRLRFVKPRDHRLVHRAGQRVFLVRPVQRDRQDAVALGDEDLVAHDACARIDS